MRLCAASRAHSLCGPGSSLDGVDETLEKLFLRWVEGNCFWFTRIFSKFASKLKELPLFLTSFKLLVEPLLWFDVVVLMDALLGLEFSDRCEALFWMSKECFDSGLFLEASELALVSRDSSRDCLLAVAFDGAEALEWELPLDCFDIELELGCLEIDAGDMCCFSPSLDSGLVLADLPSLDTRSAEALFETVEDGFGTTAVFRELVRLP